MAKQLNVNLAFTADTAQAKQQLQQLQQQLNNIISGSTAKQLGFDTEINKGIDAAARLKLALQEATNATTGKLDLGKFDQQIKKSGLTIKEYGANLSALGPKGQEAFLSLARSVSNAEIPLARVSSKIASLGTTLKNTLKWQISSSVLHGFMGAISGAYQYAQDLNESLNNIRIVTGQSVEEMDKFAAKANKAAKALSSSTTEYTNAALIYYQQGLNDSEVKKRTDTTIKLANVSRESAETVSEWMTAIWNNFDNGTRSLESYADTITALGAATASSADEIAQGLEKFSAIADTVGLSYDYATSALATVTAQTRQSADVVGTAFKTLFARLEGLKLGETLEDGVTLNQYSESLAAVGINILNANGELKDMDTILDSLGSRWDTLSKAQQVGLAQTVGGIRQYNQLISLMDNWDVFQQNLIIAQTSEGSLQEQADIYAESWEGAQKRVKASAQAIYSDLLDDDFFIDLLNGFGDVLDTINTLIDSFGGVKGVLLAVSTLLLQVTGPKIAKGLENMALNMKYFFNPAKAQADANAIKNEMWKTAGAMSTDTGTQAGAAMGDAFKQEAKMQRALIDNTAELSEYERQIYQMRLDNVRVLQEENIERAKAKDLAEDTKDQTYREYFQETGHSMSDMVRITGSSGVKEVSTEEALMSADRMYDIGGHIDELGNSTLKQAEETLRQDMESFSAVGKEIPKELQEIYDAIESAIANGVKKNTKVGNVKPITDAVKNGGKAAKDAAHATARDVRDQVGSQIGGKDALKAADKAVGANKKLIQANEDYAKSQKDSNNAVKAFLKDIDKTSNKTQHWSTSTVKAAQGISSLSMGISTAVGVFQTLSNAVEEGSFSFTDFLGITTSLAMSIPMVINGVKSLSQGLGISNTLLTIQKDKFIALSAAEKAEALSKMFNIDQKITENLLDKEGNLSKGKAIVLALSMKAAKLLEAVGISATVPAYLAEAAAAGSAAAATMALLWPIGLLVVALAGVVGAVALVVGIFKTLSNAYNADTIAAEKAKKEAKSLADTYVEVKDRYEELKQSIEDYKDAQNAIDELKEGTKEWRDAVSEANLEILSLLDKYPKLAQYIQTLEGGRMIISDEGIAKVTAEEAERVALMANMSTSANVRAKQAQNKADTTKLTRKLKSQQVQTNSYASAEFGYSGDDQPVTLGSSQFLTLDSFVEKLSKDYEQLGEKVFVGLEDKLKELGVTSDTAAQDLRKLIVEEKQLAEMEETTAQSQIDNLLLAQSNFNSKAYTEGIQKQAKKRSDQILKSQNITADAMHQYSDWNLAWQAPLAVSGPGSLAVAGLLDATGAYIETSSELGDETIKKYLEAKGLSSDQYKGLNFKGDKVVWKEKGEGDSGDWSKKELSYEALAEFAKQDYLAEHAAEIVEAMNNLMATTHTLSLSNNASEQALASYLAEGDLDMMSPEVYNKLKDTSKEEITKIFKDNATVFKAAGYASAEELSNGFEEALLQYDPVKAQQNLINKQWADFSATISQGAKELKVSESALKTYTEILMTENTALTDNIDIAGQSAVAHFKLAKGIEKIRTALEDNLGVLENVNTNSLEYAEALGAVRDAVAKTFGMNVSANFVEDNLKTIKSMTEGNIEAFRELQKLIVSDFVEGLQLESGAKDKLQKEIDGLVDKAQNLEVKGTLTLDNTDAISALNTALENGSATKEEIEAMFSNMNLAFPDTTITTYKKPTRTTTFSQNEVWDQNNNVTRTTTKSTVTSEVELPWIGNNRPQFKTDATGAYEFDETTGEAKKIEGTGKSGSISGMTKTAEMSSDNLKNITSYDSDAKGETEQDRKQRIKSLNDEIDRYHEIKSITNSLSKEMDKLSKAKDRAFGGQKLAYMDAELEVLDAQIAAQDKIIAQAQNYLALDKKNLEQFGVKYNKDGTIANYTDIQTKYLNKLAATDPNSDKYDEINEEYKTFKDYASQYEETWDKVQGEMSKKTDLTFDRLENRLAKIDYKIEIKVEVQDHELNILERQLKRLDDDAYDGASRIKNMTEQTGKAYKKQQINKDGIKDTLKEAGVSDKDIKKYMSGDGEALAKYDLSSSTIEQLEKFTNGFIKAQEQMEKLAQSIKDEVMVTFDAWHEKIDDVGAAIEHQGNVIKSYQNIVDIVGKDRLGIDDKVLKQMEAINNQTAQAQLNNAKVQKETTESALKTAQEKKSLYKKGTEEYEYWASQEEKLNKQLMKDTENFMSSWENALTVAYETFAAQNERAIENFSDMLAGANFDSLDDLAEAFDRAAEKSDQYLENYEKTYELSKLNRKIQNDINKSDNPKAKQMLQELQQEITAAQADGVKLSEHDLKILQKKYDLKLAEIALENAQGNKNQVRLQRDSQGNYNYVYTTDKTAVTEAEQKYEDSVYEIQKLNDDYLDDLSKRVIENRQEMIERLAQLDIKDYENADAYYKARDKIIQEHQDKEVFLFGEMQKTIDSNLDIYNTDVARYSNYTNQKMAQDDNWVLDFDETALAICSGYETMEQAQLDFTTGTEEFVANNKSAYDTFEFNVSNAMDLAGTSIDDFAKAVNIAMYGEDGKGGAVGNIKDLEDKTNKYGTTAQKKFGESANKVVEWYKKYGSKLNKGKKQTDLLEESISKLKSKSITIKTSVSGESQVNKLIKSIEKISDEIKKLKDTDFKITANVKIKNQGKITTEEEDKKYKVQEIAASTTGTRYKVNNKWYSLDELNAPNQGHTEKDDEVSIKSWATGDKKAFETISFNDASLDAEDAEDIRIYDEDGNGGSLRYGVIGKNISIEDLKERKIVGYKYNKTLKTNLYKLDKPIWVGGTDSTYWLNQTDLHQLLDQDGWEALYKRYNLQKLDTGGYTGEWGPEGRLAMLHQKEIVLNAHDTENLLTAVSMIREISSQLESNALAMQYAGALANYRTNVTSASDTLQQEVHITAEFPNATNHSEIEEAFRNLTNLASQYANRK